MGMPLASTAVERLMPRFPLSTGLLCPPSRLRLLGLGDAAIDGHLKELQADVSVVGFEHHRPQGVDHPVGDPLVAALAQRGGRTLFVGDPALGAAEH
jgi:hypothetical protein